MALKHAIQEFSSSSAADDKQQQQQIQLSCKIRLFEDLDRTLHFAKQLQSAGCDSLSVHCRTRADKHDGAPNFRAGRALVDALSIPVAVNGGCDTRALIDVALAATGASAVMVARGFLANPRLLVEPHADPASLAAEYLECAHMYPPPSPLFIRKHLRWIFRETLEPADATAIDYKDWRPRLWTFLVRPYLETMDQFRQVVALYVKLNGSEMPESLKDVPEPSFKSIRHANRKPVTPEEPVTTEKRAKTVSGGSIE